ncbi:MAG TPA: hypothetical protein PK228_14950 [Saprospiraceae bacterium]|nr:hypothetical protein [Saprospiraceae bacterium]
MSEFQLYHFKSIDRPLTETERKEIGTWSSRTNPTANSATFTFSYRDFPKDEETVVEKYFDAMLYAANWGTKRLMFRLPKDSVDAESLAAFTFDDEWAEDYIRLTARKTCFLLDICFRNEAGGAWLEEDSYDLDDLTPLREDMLAGDYRSLYLIWIQFALGFSVDKEEENEEDRPDDETIDHTPPPIPANLAKLTGALQAFIDFFEIDPDLVAAAQSVSPASKTEAPDFRQLIGNLAKTERTDWLMRLANGEPRLDLTFRKHLQQLAPSKKRAPMAGPSLVEMKALIRTKEKERLDRNAKAAQQAHIQRMEQLVRQEDALWENVEKNLLKATSKSYDLAIDTLKDLRNLALYQGKEAGFNVKMRILREQFARKRGLIGRFDEAGL